MSSANARIVYGVPATTFDICDFRDDHELEWEDICDKWVIDPDTFWYGSEEFVIGFDIEHVDEGRFEELGNLNEPPDEDISALREVLERLGIKGEPTWLLMCQVS